MHRRIAGIISILAAVLFSLENSRWFSFLSAPLTKTILMFVALATYIYFWLFIKHILTTQLKYTRANALILLTLAISAIEAAWRLSPTKIGSLIGLIEIVLSVLLGLRLFQIKLSGTTSLRFIGVLLFVKALVLVLLIFISPISYPIINDISYTRSFLTRIMFAVFFFSTSISADSSLEGNISMRQPPNQALKLTE